MQIISENYVELPVDGKQIHVRYRLFCLKGKEGYTHYGIGAENTDAGEALTIPDITVNRETARQLYDSLLCGKVTTVTFRDVVEDFLGAI